VLKHLPVKIAEFLQEVHCAKFPSMDLPEPDGLLDMLQVDALYDRLETHSSSKGTGEVCLHGGILVGHSRLGGVQRVYAWPFPKKPFRGWNRMDFVFVRPRGADPLTFRPDPDTVWYCQAILAFSMVVQADEARYLMKCVLVSKLEEFHNPDDPVAGDIGYICHVLSVYYACTHHVLYVYYACILHVFSCICDYVSIGR
jgi:hypothetical protein